MSRDYCAAEPADSSDVYGAASNIEEAIHVSTLAILTAIVWADFDDSESEMNLNTSVDSAVRIATIIYDAALKASNKDDE